MVSYFATVVYLINRMLIATLNYSSPYAFIFGTTPNYSKLKIFECLCYPWLRLYASYKLEPISKPCVFLGYSFSQSAYLCFGPFTSKIFMSHHVKFVEFAFPYKSLHSYLPRLNSTTTDKWIPLVLIVSTPSLTLLAPTPSVVGPLELPPCTIPLYSLPAISQQQSCQHASTSTQSTSSLPIQSFSQIPLAPCLTNHHRMTT